MIMMISNTVSCSIVINPSSQSIRFFLRGRTRLGVFLLPLRSICALSIAPTSLVHSNLLSDSQSILSIIINLILILNHAAFSFPPSAFPINQEFFRKHQLRISNPFQISETFLLFTNLNGAFSLIHSIYRILISIIINRKVFSHRK